MTERARIAPRLSLDFKLGHYPGGLGLDKLYRGC